METPQGPLASWPCVSVGLDDFVECGERDRARVVDVERRGLGVDRAEFVGTEGGIHDGWWRPRREVASCVTAEQRGGAVVADVPQQPFDPTGEVVEYEQDVAAGEAVRERGAQRVCSLLQVTGVRDCDLRDRFDEPGAGRVDEGAEPDCFAELDDLGLHRDRGGRIAGGFVAAAVGQQRSDERALCVAGAGSVDHGFGVPERGVGVLGVTGAVGVYAGLVDVTHATCAEQPVGRNVSVVPLPPPGTVTFFFTDLEGSTRLWEERPELMSTALARHDELVKEWIRTCGGTVFSAMGDGVAASFERPPDAARAAIEIQAALAREVWPDPLGPLRVRMGLHTGEAEVRDGSYFGSAVNRAARVMSIAWGGQVVCTAATASFLPGDVQLHDLGEHRLRGLSRPERVWQIGGTATFPPLRSDSYPLGDATRRSGIASVAAVLPDRLSVRPAMGLVGRDAEITTMLDAWNRVVADEGREALLISGEAGLGKTTLVAEAARAAFDAGARVLFGHCEEDLATPYQLFAEALEGYVIHASEGQLRAHVEAHGSEMVRLVPSLAGRLGDLPPSKATDSDTERYLLFAAVVGLLVQVSGEEPVVLVLDDLQWADTASLQLLRHLLASSRSMRLLVLGTYRDSELSRSHPLLETLAALRRHDGVSRIELAGLDDVGVVALMEAAAGHDLDQTAVDLAHAVYRETDGNPFFVWEVLRHLSETGAISQDVTGRWGARETLDQMSLPDSVREVIGARVGRLGERAERVLSLAAVIGRDFDLDLLGHATDTTEDALLDIIDVAASIDLVRELSDTPGRCTFAHVLIQHTLYEDLGPARRSRAHRRVAEALEVLCGDQPGSRVGELARHWFSATQPVDLTRAIGYSRQAGDAALLALAPTDALRYYAQAIDLYPQATDPDPILGIDLAIGLGTAQRQTGDPTFRDTLLGAARRAADLGDTRRLVTAVLANDRGLVSSVGAIDADKIEILELALDELPRDDPTRALVLALLCQELHYRSSLERRRALGDEALAIATASGDDVTVVRVLNSIFPALNVAQPLEESLARTADAPGTSRTTS